MQSRIATPTNPRIPSACNTLRVDSFYLPSTAPMLPSYRWALGITTTIPGTPEVPAVPDVTDEDGDVITPGTPAIPAVPARDEWEELMAGNGQFTAEQWTGWTTQPDDTYPLQCAAANLGVTLA